MKHNEKLYELEENLNQVKWDILGVSEVQRRADMCVEIELGNRLYYDESYGRIRFLIKKHIKQNVVKYKSILIDIL